MQERPPVTITDPSRRGAAGGGAPRDPAPAAPDGASSAPRPRAGTRWGRLLAAGLVGFLGGQLLPADGQDPGTGPRLALVVGSQPVLDAQPGLDPTTSAEVTLVNTGGGTVRLTGAVAEGLGLRWSADEVLRSGEHVLLALRAGGPCARAAGQPGGPELGQVLRVTVRPSGEGRSEQVVLPLPGSLVTRYDAFTRSFCGLPTLAQGLDVITEAQSVRDGEVLVTVGLVSRTVERLRLVEVTPTVPGLALELRDLAGTPVPLPLEVPGRPTDLDLREVDRYVVGVRAGPEACRLLRRPLVGTEDLVRLLWVAEGQPTRLAATAAGDLPSAVREACG